MHQPYTCKRGLWQHCKALHKSNSNPRGKDCWSDRTRAHGFPYAAVALLLLAKPVPVLY